MITVRLQQVRRLPTKGQKPFTTLKYYQRSRRAALPYPSQMFLVLWPLWTGSKLLTYHPRFCHEIQFSIVRSYFLFAIQFFVQPNRLLHYFYIFQFRSNRVSPKNLFLKPQPCLMHRRDGVPQMTSVETHGPIQAVNCFGFLIYRLSHSSFDQRVP